ERAIDGIVERHQILRTRFDMVDGQPVQVVVPRLNGHAVEVHNLSHLSVAAQEAEILHLAQAEGRKPFDLAGGPLLRVTLLVLGERDHVLLFTLHHIIADGWSAGILFREFAALYRAYGEGRPAPLADLPLQYRDFAHWQRGWMQGERLERLIAYWRKTLEGAPPLLELPIDYPRPSLQSDSGATHAFRLPPALLDPLRALSRQHGVTLFVTLVSAFNVLLHRYSGQADICLGASVANRGRPEFEALIGLFANMLVLRGDLSGNPRFVELLQRMQAVCVGALGHQDLPFEKLVEALNPVRDRSYSPFFQVVFVLHNLPAGAPEVAGLTIQPLEIDFGTAKSDLTLHVTERDGIAAVFEYSTDLFEPATIVRMAAHLTRLLEDVVARPQCRLNELSLLGAGEYRQLLGWSAPTEEAIPANALLHADFEAQARKHPERIALRCGTEQLCYGELDRRANQLAHYLLAHGVGPEVNVGLCLERSPEAIVGLLGILKAGGAYVPLAPDYPPARIAELLADCGAALLLTQQRLAAALPGAMPCTVINGGFVPPLPPGEGWGEGNPNNAIDDRARHSLSTLCLDRDWPKVAAQPEQRPPARARPANAAYLIYTSGSTGAPKGVLVSHANAAASTAARFRFYPAAPGGFLLLSPFAFDSSVAGIFWTLSGGGTLCIPPESSRRDPGAIAALCAAAAPSHLLCLPSLYEPLLELARPGQLDSLQGVIVAGET
ncbi:MAG: non-ribosomal peptide synthetase, partial [Methylococcaceae bacterium]